jgi:hypothetical protein
MILIEVFARGCQSFLPPSSPRALFEELRGGGRNFFGAATPAADFRAKTNNTLHTQERKPRRNAA